MAYSEFDRITRLFAAVLSPFLAGSACGESQPIDEDQFTLDVCSSTEFGMLAKIEPAVAVDYVEVRLASYASDEEGGAGSFSSSDLAGEPCGGASDKDACLAALAALPTDGTLYPGGNSILDPVYGVVVYTRGDEVAAITDRAGLLAFLGSIDSEGDAALYGWLSGHDILCGDGNEVGVDDEGYTLFTSSGDGCGKNNDIEHHVVLVRADGTFSVLDTQLIERGDPNCTTGRLPPGLCRPTVRRAASPVGAFFAEVAHLEAASVPAFSQLARELARHGAPASMIREALHARDDERRHARVIGRLARKYGGRPSAPRVRPTPPRPLVEVLADNAAEGCVRETYGALVAHAQARRAADPQVRRALARIAEDETRHAALSWSLTRWARARMCVPERRRVARAFADGFEQLEAALARPCDPQVHALAGLPEPVEAQAMLTRLRAALRAESAA